MKTRTIPVSAGWLATLFQSLEPDERGCADGTGDHPSLVLERLCLKDNPKHAGDSENHVLIFVGDCTKEEFGNLLKARGVVS